MSVFKGHTTNINENGEIEYDVHKKLSAPRPRYSPWKTYDGNDEISESNRKEKNKKIIKGIVKALRIMEQEAKMEFLDLLGPAKNRLIVKRKSQINYALGKGDFTKQQRKRLEPILDRMIDRRYEPFIERVNRYGKIVNEMSFKDNKSTNTHLPENPAFTMPKEFYE